MRTERRKAFRAAPYVALKVRILVAQAWKLGGVRRASSIVATYADWRLLRIRNPTEVRRKPSRNENGTACSLRAATLAVDALPLRTWSTEADARNNRETSHQHGRD